MARRMACALKTRQFNSLGRGTDLDALNCCTAKHWSLYEGEAFDKLIQLHSLGFARHL